MSDCDMELIFFRHPTPDAAPGLCYGRLDLDIGPTGQAEVARACQTPPNVAQMIASPARRALALAEPLSKASNAALTIDDRLWEMDMGQWEGVFWSGIDRRDSDPWAEDALNRPTPGGEAFVDVIARVQAVLDEIDAPTCIVAHAGPIRAARMLLNGVSFDEAFAEPVPFAKQLLFTLDV